MNKLLSYYTSLFGASGCEGDVRRAIINEISPFADVRTDKLGNVIAFRRGRQEPPATVMFSAHMDEVGMILTSITEKGYLKFDAVGGIDPRTLCGKAVCVGRRKIPGVIGERAPHLMKKGDEDHVKKISDMYVDIGAKDKADAEKHVSPGDAIGFVSDYAEFGDGLVRAKALDDRVGCQILTELIKKDLPYDAWFCFNVMEEIGCIGAAASAFAVKADVSVVIEGTTAADITDKKNVTKVCSLHSGPVLSFMDRATVYDRKLLKLAMQACDENGIPWQLKQAVAGGNDSGRIQRTGSGAAALAVSVPVRYLHTAMGVAALDDIENTGRLAYAILEKIGGTTIC